MTQDEIIRMAREAGLIQYAQIEKTCVSNALERFAALVAAHEREKFQAYVDQVKFDREASVLDGVLAEREACAKVCDDREYGQDYAYNCAAAIRARGEK